MALNPIKSMLQPVDRQKKAKIGTLVGFFLLSEGLFALPMSCHIHPPGELAKQLISGFISQADCEAVRKQRFAAEGVCHCQASFARPRSRFGRGLEANPDEAGVILP